MGKELDGRRLSSKALWDLRQRVVDAVKEEGLSQSEAARIFGVCRASVNRWVGMAQGGGAARLKPAAKGRPRGGQLTKAQSAQVVKWVVGKQPDQLRLPFALWTREAVQQLIAEKFHLSLSLSTVGRYLKAWHMTPQVPMKRAIEQNPQAVKKWLQEEYPRIRKRAKRAGGIVFFEDETGLRSDHVTGTSYAIKGKTPIVPGTGKRFGANLISAISAKGKMHFMVYEENFTGDVFVRFLERVLRQAKGKKVFLIADRHRAHHSKKVQRWLGERKGKIELHFLPPYSPELNPTECLNNDVKSNAVGRKRAKDKHELLDNVRSYMRATQRSPDIIQSFFREKYVLYTITP